MNLKALFQVMFGNILHLLMTRVFYILLLGDFDDLGMITTTARMIMRVATVMMKFTALKVFEQRQAPKRDICWCSNIKIYCELINNKWYFG